MDEMVTLYVIHGETGKRYTGITNDLERRMGEHRRTSAGKIIGDFVLLHTEEFEDYRTAREREIFLKSGAGRKWLNQEYPRTGSAGGG